MTADEIMSLVDKAITASQYRDWTNSAQLDLGLVPEIRTAIQQLCEERDRLERENQELRKQNPVSEWGGDND